MARVVPLTPPPGGPVVGWSSDPAADSRRSRGCRPALALPRWYLLTSLLERFVRQEEARNTVPLWFFGRRTQGTLAGLFATAFGVLGGTLLHASRDIYEVRFPYSAGVSEMVIEIERDIKGTAFLSYELPEFYANQKRFIESKDDWVVGGLVSRYTCKDAGTVDEVTWRRCPEGASTCREDTLIRNLERGRGAFRPCGLAALAMFTDRYELQSYASSAAVRLDESDLALPSDHQIFEKRILPVAGGPAGNQQPYFEVRGEPSWLEGGSFYEHFKVWYRQPASPCVRNLWARIPDGLERGRYILKFLENSHVWTGAWKLPEKRVVISQAHALGSPSSCRFLGVVCLAFSCVQVVAVGVFFLLPRVVDKQLEY